MPKKACKKIAVFMALIFALAQTILIAPVRPALAQTVAVQLDGSYYRTGATVTVTVTDVTANTDAQAEETVTVKAISNSDTAGINVQLTETGASTGVFTGSFALAAGASGDGSDILQVSNGDTITVTYNNGTDTATCTATVDDTPPGHVSHTPASDARGVDPGISQVTVVFDEPVNLGGASGNISIVDLYGNDVNIASKQITSDNTLELGPYSLSYSKTYTVTIPAGAVVDRAGNPNAEVTWSFRTVYMELDRETYKSGETVYVTLYDQAKGSGSVTVVAECDNYESEAINVDLSGSGGVFTGSFRLSGPGGNSDDSNDVLGVTGYYDGFTVSYDRDNDGTYEVSVSGYADNEAPIVSSHSPAAGATGVDIAQPVTITFSEKIQAGSQFNLIDIGYNDGPAWHSAGGITPSIEGNTLTIAHDPLEYSRTYDVLVYSDSVQDLVGNPYNPPAGGTGQTVFQFTTQARPINNIHVATDGDDSTGDGTENKPYRTISRALQAAFDGDTIVVHEGTYNESVVVSKDVTITSLNGPGSTVLQPSGGDGFAIQPASGSYRTRRITGFTITGAAHGISVSGMAGGLVYLENNVITGCGDGVYIDNHAGGTVYVQKNTIAGNTAGIQLGTNADGSKTRVKWNNITGNGTGIAHNGTGQLDVPLNYWGSPHGPSHDGVNYGDTVTGDVDFQPWLVAESVGEEITTELDITAPTLGDGYVGLEYLAELPIQPNVGSTLQWSLYSGSLPGGVEIVSGKTLYGTPAAAGSYSFPLEASNGTQAVYRNVSLNVATDYTGSGPAVVTRSPVPYEAGVAVDESIVIVFNKSVQLNDNYQGYINITNPEDHYEIVYKVASVQTTVINNDTLVIDPTYNLRPATSYEVAISTGIVTDSEGNSFAGSWSFTTGDQVIPLAITTAELPPAAEGQAYSAQLAATGGSGRHIWSVVSGSLPQGLTLASLSGEISGTPATAGSYSFTVRVTDGLNNTAQKSLTLTVEGVDITPPALVSTSPANNATGVSRDIMITVEFSEPIQAGSNFDGISLGLALSKTIEGNILKLTPGGLLDKNTWYTVEIPAGAVQDSAGNSTANLISFSFQTGAAQDSQPPQVVITTPADGAVLGGRQTVTGNITEESLAAVEVSLYRPDLQQYWNGSSWLEPETWNQASFSGTAPNYQFQYVLPTLPDGNYQVRVRARDDADNESEAKTVSFAMDSTAPQVQYIGVATEVLLSGATNVPVDQPFWVTFSEPVALANQGLVSLEDADTQSSVLVAVTFSEQTNTLIITPTAPLEYSKNYQLFIKEGTVKDLTGNDNVECVITFQTAEGEAGGGGDGTPQLPQIAVDFIDDDTDGIYYYRPNGQSDTLEFSLFGLPSGLSLAARFGALVGGEFTVTGAVYDGDVDAVESEAEPGGTYTFTVGIATPDDNDYQPLAVELSGLPAGMEVPPFLLAEAAGDQAKPRLAFVNIYPPIPPEESGLELLVDPALDTVANLHAVPGVTFTAQRQDGTMIGSIAIGSKDNPVDFLAVDENGAPELLILNQALEIAADAANRVLAAEINTELLRFLAGKSATITFYNVAETLGLQLSEDNFRNMLEVKVFDNNGSEIENVADYIDPAAMTYSTTSGPGYDDMLEMPVNHFTRFEVIPTDIPADTTAPEITLSGVSDGLWSREDVTVEFSATDDTDPNPVITAVLTRDRSHPTGFTSGTSISEEGVYTLAVEAVDASGNQASLTVNFKIDKTAPVIAVSGVEDRAESTAGFTPAISVSDAMDEALEVTATLQKGSEVAQPYTSGTPVSEEGQYTLTVTARDAAGNEAQTVVHFTIGGTAAGSPGGATGGGDTTASGGGKEDTGINASNVTDVVSDPNSSENKVAEAVGNASDSLINIAERVETTSDAEKVVDAAAGIAGAITRATDRVESEDAAAKVASSAVKVTEALAKAASRVTSDAARQKLIESAVVSLDAVENAALKIASAEKAAAAAIAQAAALRNIKHIMQVTADAKAVVGIMTKTASVLDSNARLIARAAGPEEAAAVAKEIIDGVAALTKAATAAAITDYGVRQAAKKVQEKVVRVAEKAIEKAGTERIATDEVVVEGAKARISIEAERLEEKAVIVVEKAQELASRLEENNLEPHKQLEKKISVEIPAVEGIDGVEVAVPSGVSDTVFASGIDKIEIKTGVADFGLSPNTFGNYAKGKGVTLEARKLTREQLPAAARAAVSDSSVIVDLNAAAGGERISSFAAPIEASIPYILQQGDDPEAITVFLIKEDGAVEPVGGKYDPAAGKVRFITNHFSSYFAKPAAREFSDLDGYAWAEREIELLAGKGIIKGKTASNFDPAANITRAEFAVLLGRMLKLEDSGNAVPFTDVAPGAWYARGIAAVYKSGIVSGRSATEFDPDGKITREEMAAMVARVLARQGYTGADEAELAVFRDAGEIAPWAKTSVATAVREEILKGMADGVFAPRVYTSRAQAAVVLYRLFVK